MEFRDVLIRLFITLLALIIWDLFLSDVCRRIRHNHWLNSKISCLKRKTGREFFHKLFRINKMTGYAKSPSRSEYVDSFWQCGFESRPLDNICINVQNQKKVFEGVCRIEVKPKGYESLEYILNITILDSNGGDKKIITLEISREDKRRLANKIYDISVLYHKKWNK